MATPTGKPVVHLIGGSPGAGKTTLGIALASRLGRSSTTLDDLRTSLLGISAPESFPELRVIGLPDPATYFTTTDPETMIAHAMQQHRALWPAIDAVVRKKDTYGIPTVLDGWHLIPELVAEGSFTRTRAVWIDVDEDVFRVRERSVWDFYATSDDPDRMYEHFVQRSVRWNALMRDEASRFGFHVLTQDGSRSVDDLVEEVLDLDSAAGGGDL